MIPNYIDELIKPVSGITIGIFEQTFKKGLDNEINQNIQNAIGLLKTIGIKFVKLSVPLLDYSLPMYGLIARSETSSNLARYDGVRYGNNRTNFSIETTNRIMIGTYSLSTGYYDAYYRQAQKVRTLIINAYKDAFKKCNAIIFPVSPIPPTKLGEIINDPLANLLLDIYNCTQNPAGIPSLAIPCGFTSQRLPVAFQLTGPMFSENLLLRIGYHYQENTNWHNEKPDILNIK